MSWPGRINAMQPRLLVNRITREELQFEKTSSETRGRMLRLQIRIPPYEEVPVAHVHERQSERLTVLSGSLWITQEGQTRLLAQGESAVFRPGTGHSWCNRSGEWALIRCELFPALNTEEFFSRFITLVNSGLTRKSGKPGLLQAVRLIREYFIFSARYPVWLQKVAVVALYPLARLFRPRTEKNGRAPGKNHVPA